GVIGEHWTGSARDHNNAVYLTISTGIGGGVMVDGRPIFGRGGNAGEIGHLFVDDSYHLRCRCGETGHWEAYAAGGSLPKFYAIFCSANGYPVPERRAVNTEEIFEAAAGGDRAVLAFMDMLGKINARGVSDVVVAFDPEIIILDGGVGRNQSERIISSLSPYLDEYLNPPPIRRTVLDGNAPLLGAARSVFEAFGRSNQRFLSLPP
ncbi:MAG: ROK family protein, partial [Methanomicrobiaceae archaeon]|nr:ROK family protein [Methanomicrobiaceae archaeon]